MKLILSLVVVLTACASGTPIHQQEYAALKDSRTMEHEFPIVWKGIEKALASYRISERNPEEVTAEKLRKLDQRIIATDWVNGQSRDKYVEYRSNNVPHKKYLQTRLRYEVTARKVIGGTDVRVHVDEEIENLKPNGDPSGWSRVERKDSSRAHDLIERIQLAVLSE